MAFGRPAVAALVILLHQSPASADAQATSLRLDHGKFVVVQSYCSICGDARSACIVKCNGAGACIQKCDDDYLTCREHNCGRR